jgi:hypothetical protein
MCQRLSQLVLFGALVAVAPAAARPETAEPWSFRPLASSEPPPDAAGWSEGPVDRFVIARLQERGLRPAGAAGRGSLPRRFTFDLIGLPPTPEEVADFEADQSPDAFVRVVDRLLTSPAYGERWARHRLDMTRYPDTGGFQAHHL